MRCSDSVECLLREGACQRLKACQGETRVGDRPDVPTVEVTFAGSVWLQASSWRRPVSATAGPDRCRVASQELPLSERELEMLYHDKSLKI